MKKKVGKFSLYVCNGGHPVSITIEDEEGNEIKFTHHSISDLEHVVREAKKACLIELPDPYKCEV
jgi:hypothetical protein